MSKSNPFGKSDTCDNPRGLFPVNTRVSETCSDIDGLYKAVNMIRGIYNRLADPDYGSKLVAYTKDQTVQEILQYLVNAVENGGGSGGSYDDTELRSLISDKLNRSEFSTFIEELELSLESTFDQKVDKVVGKELSSNDFTDPLRDKLIGIVSGVTYVQDSLPSNPLDQESWYNPLTLQLKVFNNGAWRPVSPDGGHF